jgi:hypothetical protein
MTGCALQRFDIFAKARRLIRGQSGLFMPQSLHRLAWYERETLMARAVVRLSKL